MRKSAVILALGLIACEDQNCPEPAAQASSTPFTTAEKVLLHPPGTLAPNALTVFKGTRLTVVVDQDCRQNGAKGFESHTWVLGDNTTIQKLKVQADQDPCIIGIGPSVTLKSFAADPDISKQTHLATTKALEAASKFFDSKTGIKDDVVLAVIDTGVESSHEDLRDNMWVNPDEIPGNGRDDDKNGKIDDVNGYNFAERTGNANPAPGEYHGTHVAGLAAARADNGKGGAGVMGQKIKIMSLNVFGNQGGAETADLDNAIRYAADNGAHIINMSLGGRGTTPSTEQAIAYAIKKGTLVLAAAGNDGRVLDSKFFVTPGSYGGKFSGMLTVGSTDTRNDRRSGFSNFSPVVVEIAAPGSVDSEDSLGLYSTVLNGRYSRAEGTSMATPVAAGAAALAIGLVKSRGHKATPALIEQLLVESARSVSGLNGVFKSGIVDANKLYEFIDQRYPAAQGTPQPTAEPTPGPSPTPTPGPGTCPVTP